MAKLSIYCGCSDKLTRLAVLEPIEPISLEGFPIPDDWSTVWDSHGALQSVEARGIGGVLRDALRRDLPVEVDKMIVEHAHSRPVVREPTVDELESGHGRWEWVCRRCGRHHQATDKRLRAAVEADTKRLVFGIDL